MDSLSFFPDHLFQLLQQTLWKKSSVKKIKITKRHAYCAEVLILCYYFDKRLSLLYKIINAINQRKSVKKVGQNH